MSTLPTRWTRARPLESVWETLGHASRSTTSRYVHACNGGANGHRLQGRLALEAKGMGMREWLDTWGVAVGILVSLLIAFPTWVLGFQALRQTKRRDEYEREQRAATAGEARGTLTEKVATLERTVNELRHEHGETRRETSTHGTDIGRLDERTAPLVRRVPEFSPATPADLDRDRHVTPPDPTRYTPAANQQEALHDPAANDAG